MRKFLFRGKSKGSNTWIYGDLIQRNHYADYYIRSHSTGKYHKVFSQTVGEYTGISDINDQMIFVDDLVSFPYKYESLLGLVVSLDTKGFRIYPYYTKKYSNSSRYRFVSNNCKVISSYHDLEDKNENLYKLVKQHNSCENIMAKYEIIFSSGRKDVVEDSRVNLEGGWKSGSFIKDMNSNRWFNTSLIESVKRVD